MLNSILQRIARKSKSYLTNPNPEYKIVFKPGAIEDIKKVKGYKNDSLLAQDLGITRAYVSMMKHQKASVTATVITRLAYLLGSTNGNWWAHFEITSRGYIDQNHPLWHNDKYLGKMPYSELSVMAELRGKDYKVERNKLDKLKAIRHNYP
jgi:hypothetical protein